VGAVLLTRPDAVYGARDLSIAPAFGRGPIGAGVLAVAGVAVALLFATGLSQVAGGDPDGLERVAIDQGFASSAQESVLADSLFADYATSGVGNEALGLAVAGAAGVALTLAVGYGLVGTSRRLAP
jgi:cobalt/nickel transport system permease protein